MVERAPSLSHEEKEALSKAIEELPAESMGEVFRIMHMDAREGEEVEVDLNSLPLSTLRRLQSFVERVGTSRRAIAASWCDFALSCLSCHSPRVPNPR